jgi:hypothetical protein
MSSSGLFPPAVSFPGGRDNRANWKCWGFERKKRLHILQSSQATAFALAQTH